MSCSGGYKFPYDHTTGIEIKAMGIFDRLLKELSNKYCVDEEEIVVGLSDIPPSDPTVLVYVRLCGYPMEYFRKNMLPGGRWVCRQYFKSEAASSSAPFATILPYRPR